MVGLLDFFRDRGLGVPSISLFLDLFSARETAEGFLYFSRRSYAPLVISDLPSSHRLWKERYFFVCGHCWEYDPLDKNDTLGMPVAWSTLENLREKHFAFDIVFVSSLGIYNSVLSACFSGSQLNLSSEDNVILQELAKCSSRPYAEMIRSDIPCPLRSRSIRSTTLRPSASSIMKISPTGPSVAKPTKGELLARVETLSQKSRSKKHKTLDSVEKDHPAWGNIPKLGAPSSSPSTHVRMPGQVLSPLDEIPKTLSLQSRSGSTAKAKDSSGRTVERLLKVMPITVWNPPAQSVKPSS